MDSDWRRKVLKLTATGPLSKDAVRAAYWRLIGERSSAEAAVDLERIRAAKQQLLFELGVRIPSARGESKSQDRLIEDAAAFEPVSRK